MILDFKIIVFLIFFLKKIFSIKYLLSISVNYFKNIFLYIIIIKYKKKEKDLHYSGFFLAYFYSSYDLFKKFT